MSLLAIHKGFTSGLRKLHPLWQVWVLMLLLVNGIAPLAFLETIEAKVVLVTFLFAAIVQMTMFRIFGFVRLLGLGHILPWAPMVVWLWTRLPPTGAAGAFGKWLLLVIALDTLSLVIDFVDVVRYIAGDRTPSVTVADVG